MIVKERFKKYEIVKEYDINDSETIKDIELTFKNIEKKQKNDNVVMKTDMDDYCINNAQNIAVNHIPENRFIYYHSHSFYEINYTFSGTMYQYINGKMYEVKQGCAVILSPNATHSVFCHNGTEGINILINKNFFEKTENDISCLSHSNFLSRLCKKDSYAFIDVSSVSEISCLFEMINRFKYKTTTNFSVENSCFEKMLEHTLYALQLAITNGAVSPFYETGVFFEEKQMSNLVLNYIKENLTDITLEKTAKHFGYSTMSIHRIITAKTGSNFTVYVSKLKINLAKYLLKKTRLSITEIANQTGCNTREYFAKFFKKHVSKTPSQYRNEYRQSHIEDITS